MADPARRLDTNVAGDFFVDSTCIDCDMCRQMAPGVFEEVGEYSAVTRQPSNEQEVRQSIQALLTCPTGSIGATGEYDVKSAMADFPMVLDRTDEVYHCGYTSPKSFGGKSYFICHPQGNWLIDSPKFLPMLKKRFEELGGIAFIFLSHRDDVADAAKYADAFGATRIIHKTELKSQPDAEKVIDGIDPIKLSNDFLVIPTPGHTEGHCVLLYKNKYLFTGDHLSWRDTGLRASQAYNRYSWPEQTASLKKLLEFRFEWVLPGHGRWKQLSAADMHQALSDLVVRLDA
ncbi:MAG: MBL fold metallo-hydrolase [Vampirovibrio sp.]|nr:MBL fold metallo-hydrolase [Vampirovibrio sp.]